MPDSITDYPDRLVIDTDGQTYRLEFRSSHDMTPAIGQLVGVTDSDPDPEPIPLTEPDVSQSDVDAEIARWDEWPSRIYPDDNGGHWSALTLAEVHRRLTNAGLRDQP